LDLDLRTASLHYCFGGPEVLVRFRDPYEMNLLIDTSEILIHHYVLCPPVIVRAREMHVGTSTSLCVQRLSYRLSTVHIRLYVLTTCCAMNDSAGGRSMSSVLKHALHLRHSQRRLLVCPARCKFNLKLSPLVTGCLPCPTCSANAHPMYACTCLARCPLLNRGLRIIL
jgi:hypothetical protein